MSRKSAGSRLHLRTTGLYSGSAVDADMADVDVADVDEEREEVEWTEDEDASTGLIRVPPWTSEYSVALMSGCFIIYRGRAMTTIKET